MIMIISYIHKFFFIRPLLPGLFFFFFFPRIIKSRPTTSTLPHFPTNKKRVAPALVKGFFFGPSFSIKNLFTPPPLPFLPPLAVINFFSFIRCARLQGRERNCRHCLPRKKKKKILSVALRIKGNFIIFSSLPPPLPLLHTFSLSNAMNMIMLSVPTRCYAVD